MGRNYSVMLVDDEEDVIRAIMHRIDWEEIGLSVPRYAHNGLEALEMAEEDAPDIVMTDIKMPYMDGLELSRKLKEQYPNIRVIIFSGFDEFEYAREAIRLEAEEYLLKPLNAAELAVLEKIAKDMQGRIPCTGCRYCCAGCPVGLNIPMILSMANELQVSSSMNLMMRYSALGDGKRAADCIACGQCREACPQKIDVPAEMAKFAEAISTQKTWEEVCRERAEAAEKA